ncbi:MAG: UbiA family prenyltransferase, partial [Candidatus Micrarchaeota archaeon]|nr:UbiA family prenyltransferase [Candidatus Micrarchaeota archaeon]
SLLYSYKLKDMPLIGNMYIAFSMSIPFIFGNYVLSANLSSAIAVIFVMVFFSGLAREIDGTIRDYEGDTKIRKATTLPKLIGNFASARIAFVLYAAAVIISIYLFYDVTPFSHNLVYALLIAIADISLLYSGAAFVLGKKRSYDFVRNVSLAGMGLALVCVLISSLVYIQTPF